MEQKKTAKKQQDYFCGVSGAFDVDVDRYLQHVDPSEVNLRIFTALFFKNEAPVCVWYIRPRSNAALVSVSKSDILELQITSV